MSDTIIKERNKEREDSPSVCECECSHTPKKGIDSFQVNILGSAYTIKFCGVDEDSQLKDSDGICDFTTKEILIKNDHKIEPDSLKNMSHFKNKVLRHELIHAFLYESGLSSQSLWAENEEMIDWIAIQFPKIKTACEVATTKAIIIGQL